jgi:predicted nuclease with TOPRIM domain
MDDLINTRKAYREKVEAKWEELEHKVEAWKASMKGKTADTKISLDDRFRDIDDKMTAGRAHLKEMRDDRKDGWDHLRDKLDGVIEGIQDKLHS